MNKELRAEKLKEITDTLEKGIGELFQSERYKDYLRTMARFHNYSFSNCILIYLQKPDASLVAGYKTWQKVFKRNVKKGEKGITIIAPSPYNKTIETEVVDEEGNRRTETEEREYMSFRTAHVYDVSQTEGKELPEIAKRLDSGIDDYSGFFNALITAAPVPIQFKKMDAGINGYYHQTEKRIYIREGMSEAQTIKTTIHEIAHSLLHDRRTDGQDTLDERKGIRRREVEAESVAYAVCSHYGIDTSEYSFGYIAGWNSDKELPELKASLETIRETANKLIEAIDTAREQLSQSVINYIDTNEGGYSRQEMQM